MESSGYGTSTSGATPFMASMLGMVQSAGLNAVAIARRLKCRTVLFPEVGAVLSAAGAIMSELRREFVRTEFMRVSHFDVVRANAILAGLLLGAFRFAGVPVSTMTGSLPRITIELMYTNSG